MALDRKTEKKLKNWEQASLITSEQSLAIRQHEEKYGHSSLLFGIGWLAAACIVLGIVALIASNWEYIPAALKLVLYFGIFGLLGFTLLKGVRDRPIVQEILRLVLMGYTLAGIGLIAQIYHLHGAPWRGIAFWCLCTIGLAISCGSAWGALLWLPSAIGALTLYLSGLSLSEETGSLIAIAITAGLGTSGSLRRHLIWRHFQNVAFVLATLTVFFYTIIGRYNVASQSWFTASVTAFAVIALGIWAAALVFNKSLNRGTRFGFWVFLGFAALQIVYLHTAQSTDYGSIVTKIVSVLFFVLGTLGLAVAAFSFGKRRLFEGLCFLIFFRLLGIYAELLVSMSATGFGLISIGVFMLAGLYAWHKLKASLFKTLEVQLSGTHS